MTISNQTVERCIEECLQCLRWCAQCRAESLNEDPVMMRDCIRLCNECLELCRTCVALLTGSSEFAHRVCGICSDLCRACASECGKYDGETMRKCAQACRQCAATCAEIAQGGQSGGLLHKKSQELGYLPLTLKSGKNRADRVASIDSIASHLNNRSNA